MQSSKSQVVPPVASTDQDLFSQLSAMLQSSIGMARPRTREVPNLTRPSEKPD